MSKIHIISNKLATISVVLFLVSLAGSFINAYLLYRKVGDLQGTDVDVTRMHVLINNWLRVFIVASLIGLAVSLVLFVLDKLEVKKNAGK